MKGTLTQFARIHLKIIVKLFFGTTSYAPVRHLVSERSSFAACFIARKRDEKEKTAVKRTQ